MEDSGFSVPEENADRIAGAYAYGGEPGKLAPKSPPSPPAAVVRLTHTEG